VAYGTNTPESDEDHGGVYLEPIEQILGLGLDFQDEIADEKHDNTWYSLKKYLTLLLSSNPNILESLFIDDKFVIYEHPIITEFKKHRQEFVTKDCFNSFIGYAIAQIKRARGYNKMCVQPITERKEPLDFCFTSYKQGSACMREWLAARGLEQKYCGLVSLNNMPDVFGVYYDFGAHNKSKYQNYEEFKNDKVYIDFVRNTPNYYKYTSYLLNVRGYVDVDAYRKDWFENTQPIGYRGIVKDYGVKIPINKIGEYNTIYQDINGNYFITDEDTGVATKANVVEEDGVKYVVNDINKSDTVRCSSIPKGEEPICIMTYNKDGFTQHCNKYHQYQEWVQKRSQVRYESNLGHNYDSKNVMHCFRLLNMGLEIAKTGKVQIYRKGIDADFLLDIRNHKYEYEYLIEELEKKKEELDEAIANSTLPEHMDVEKMNQILLDIRYKYQIYADVDNNPYLKALVEQYYNFNK
jgi:predicted nucleotidyltransferase